MLQHARRIAWVAALALSPVFNAAVGAAISPPSADHFVVDLAQLLESEDIATINALCNESQAQRGIPMYVVTIESMAAHGASGSAIESFAWDLFEQWGVDPAFAASPNWRHGILFLVSKDDRKARIELGMAWDPAFTARSVEIMNDVIVPAFKAGNYASGIVAGVRALATMNPSEPPVAPPAPTIAGTSPLFEFFWMAALMGGGFALLYGILVFVASKVTLGDKHFIERATSDGTRQRRSGAAEYTPLLVPGIDPSTTTYTSPSPDYFDAGGSSSSSTDSGGSFSDGGGASGSW